MITIEDSTESSRSRRSSSSSQTRKESTLKRTSVGPLVPSSGRGKPEKAIYQPPRRVEDRPTIEKMDAIRKSSRNT